MIINTIHTTQCQPQTIVIGRRGTYDTMQIAFDLSYLVESYGNGVAVLAVKRSQDESAYPAIVTQEDSTLLWTVNETDTAYVGSGECQLMWYVDGGLAKTIIYPMVVMRDILQTAEEPPDGYENWIERLTDLGAETQQNAQNAAQSASDASTAKDDAVTAKEAAVAAQQAAETAVTHYPVIINGYWNVWSVEAQSYVSTGIQAEGEDGYSPEVTITSIEGGHRVTITDKDHPQGQSFDVMDGQGGGGTSDYTDLTNKPQINGHTLTGNQTAEQLDLATPSDIPTDAGDIEYDDTETYAAGSIGAEVSDQKNAIGELNRHLSDVEENQIPELKSAFVFEDKTLELSAAEDGYVDATTGNVTGTGGGARHVSTVIDSSLVGQEINVSGVAWWGMKPFVFVGSDSSIVPADVPSPNGTVTPYTDLPFTPSVTGTLFINYHTDRPVFDATVNYLKSLKESKLPDGLADSLESIQSYKKVEFTTIIGKYLNGSTGEITNVDSTSAVISDYIEVIGDRPYLITTEHFWGQGMYVWFDSGKNYISGFSSENSGTITKIRNKKVTAPSNAKYLVIAMWVQGNFPPITLYEGQYKHIAPNLKWSGKKWVCLGDSLTGENLTCVFHYYDAVAAQTGLTVHQMGVGGSGYANDNGNNYAFWRRALTVPSDADVITIFGSFNDLSSGLQLGAVTDSDTTTIAGCMNKTIENILSVIPTANIGIVAPTPWSTTRPSGSGGSFNYVEMLRAVAERWSLPFLDLWRHSGLMPWDASFAAVAYPSGDTVHPNDVGQQIIAPKFKAFLETLLM